MIEGNLVVVDIGFDLNPEMIILKINPFSVFCDKLLIFVLNGDVVCR